jgi:signal transduction histidine kinase
VNPPEVGCPPQPGSGIPIRLLLVEDSEDDADLVLRELRRGGFDTSFERVETNEALRTALQREPWSLVISDYSLPTLDAPRTLATIRSCGLDLPVIVVSGTIGEEAAVATLRGGACDFILKDRLARLVPAVQRELREKEGREARRRAEEQKARLEELLRRSQKMEAIGTLAGGIAHDFNNLLSVIISYAAILQRALSPGDENKEDVDEIRKAGERAAELVRQLLAFSRQQMLQPRVVPMNTVVAGIGKMLKRLAGDVEISLLLDPEAGRVLADPSEIERALMNLVANARDAMPLGGTISIETTNARLDVDDARHVEVKPGEYVVVSVTDTGTGMEASTLAHVFEPFFTTKGPGKGTGLGLASVFGMVKQSGGHITVESQVGAGSTFTLYFPRSDRPTDGPGEPEITPAALEGDETILLVEDDDQVRSVTRAILRKHGYVVLEAQNGGEAFLICEKDPGKIDLLLTDLVMPRMSGRELAARLAPMRPDMKVLFVSGWAEGSVMHQGVLDSGVECLPKPVTPLPLLRKVRGILGPSRST